VAALTVLVAAPTESRAGETTGNYYSGASYGPELFVGGGRSTLADESELTASVGFRHSFVLLLGDARISYVLDAPGTSPASPDRHGLWFHGALHPLAPLIIGSDWFDYLLGSPYFEFGVGGMVYSGPPSSNFSTPAVGWSVGGGFDVPLVDLDEGDSPWLHFLYRFRTDATNLGATGGRSRTNSLLLGISWRFNGSLR